MFVYEKKLQYPVKIKNTNPKLAALIISQYGGPDGELGASLRYLSQRYSMPYPELKGLLTDIGTSVSMLLLKNDNEEDSIAMRLVAHYCIVPIILYNFITQDCCPVCVKFTC